MQRTQLTTQNQVTTKFTLGLLDGPPGGGKSTAMLTEIVTQPGLYVLAAPRIDLIAEHAARLREMSIAAGRDPTIMQVHSEEPGAKGKVSRRLADALSAADGTHAVAVTTHAAVMDLDPAELAGRHVRWDELPEGALASSIVGLGASHPMMAARYDLVPGTEAGWYRVVPRPGSQPINLRQHLNDVGKKLVDFHRLVDSPARVVEVDVSAWEDATTRPKGEVRWRSIWSFAALAECASLKVAAAGYRESLADHAVRRAGGVIVQDIPVGSPRTGQPVITIHDFTSHLGSTSWWKTDIGKHCLVAVSRHLESIGFDGYWATNDDTENFFYGRFDGLRCSPKLAGSNTLRAFTSCALIYSAKATRDDEVMIDALGLDRAVIQCSREDEDVYQFACRGAIRDPSYDGPYDIYLYSRDQAERLRDRLHGAGYLDVSIVGTPEAGIAEVVRPPKAQRAKVVDVDPETAAERKERKRKADAKRKRGKRAETKSAQAAAGIVVTRGRPKGSGKRPAAQNGSRTTPARRQQIL